MKADNSLYESCLRLLPAACCLRQINDQPVYRSHASWDPHLLVAGDLHRKPILLTLATPSRVSVSCQPLQSQSLIAFLVRSVSPDIIRHNNKGPSI